MHDFSPQTYFYLNAFPYAALFADCEYVWDALAKIGPYLQNFPLGKIEAEIPSGAYLIDKHLITIGKGAIIEPGAYIKGPCIISEGCTVRHGAYIRGNVILGKGSVVGHDSEVKNSIFLNLAHAAHFAYVGDSILGNEVNLGAGTILSNLRLDRKEIILHHEGKKISTGLRKFGAILGDGTQLGCNTVTNPGALTQKGVYSYPCVNFGGLIPEYSVVRPNVSLIIEKIRLEKPFS